MAPVFLGDVLEFTGEVTGIGDGVADLALRAKRGDDEVIRATARIVAG